MAARISPQLLVSLPVELQCLHQLIKRDLFLPENQLINGLKTVAYIRCAADVRRRYFVNRAAGKIGTAGFHTALGEQRDHRTGYRGFPFPSASGSGLKKDFRFLPTDSFHPPAQMI